MQHFICRHHGWNNRSGYEADTEPSPIPFMDIRSIGGETIPDCPKNLFPVETTIKVPVGRLQLQTRYESGSHWFLECASFMCATSAE